MDYILINNQIEYTHHEGILKCADNEEWMPHMRDKCCFVYEDSGDYVKITFLDPLTDGEKTITLNYSELQQLAVMISLHDSCEYKVLRSV
jgi:hypothetical protein